MPFWYYDKKVLRNTPSSLEGIDYETESRYRKEGARFIIDSGTKMDLGYNTMATGVVYFHRFYMFHSFKDFPRYVTACCALFLAGKVEETPKKCKDIIKTARTLLSDHKFIQFGEDPKEEVMTLERILLQTIKFDLQVEHPYSYLLRYAKCLKGDKLKLQKMVQMAWTFVNDSLCTTLCLQWEPEVIAVALMYLAGKLSKFEVVDWVGRQSKHLRWWELFVEDVTMDLLEDICHQVLDLYSQPQISPCPDSPAVENDDSPPVTVKKERISQPASPIVQQSPAATVHAIKVVKSEPKHVVPESESTDKLEAAPTKAEAAHYQYPYPVNPSYSGSNFPPTYSTPSATYPAFSQPKYPANPPTTSQYYPVSSQASSSRPYYPPSASS